MDAIRAIAGDAEVRIGMRLLDGHAPFCGVNGMVEEFE
jgi:hypothetical protein